jgi:hypothetical protein
MHWTAAPAACFLLHLPSGSYRAFRSFPPARGSQRTKLPLWRIYYMHLDRQCESKKPSDPPLYTQSHEACGICRRLAPWLPPGFPPTSGRTRCRSAPIHTRRRRCTSRYRLNWYGWTLSYAIRAAAPFPASRPAISRFLTTESRGLSPCFSVEARLRPSAAAVPTPTLAEQRPGAFEPVQRRDTGLMNAPGRWACRLQPADQQFALVDHLGRQVIMQFDQHLFLLHDLAAPCLAVEGL